jgi:hypothetical protein
MKKGKLKKGCLRGAGLQKSLLIPLFQRGKLKTGAFKRGADPSFLYSPSQTRNNPIT